MIEKKEKEKKSCFKKRSMFLPQKEGEQKINDPDVNLQSLQIIGFTRRYTDKVWCTKETRCLSKEIKHQGTPDELIPCSMK